MSALCRSGSMRAREAASPVRHELHTVRSFLREGRFSASSSSTPAVFPPAVMSSDVRKMYFSHGSGWPSCFGRAGPATAFDRAGEVELRFWSGIPLDHSRASFRPTGPRARWASAEWSTWRRRRDAARVERVDERLGDVVRERRNWLGRCQVDRDQFFVRRARIHSIHGWSDRRWHVLAAIRGRLCRLACDDPVETPGDPPSGVGRRGMM